MDAAQRHARAYGAGAEEYARVLDPWLEPILARLVELAEVGPGMRVLDLATGTGAAARLAAGAGADVTGVDIAPGMIELARRASPTEIRFEVADAAALPFEDGSFEHVLCGFGLSHLPAAALTEVRRVLAPRGRLAACAWGAGGTNPAPPLADTSLGDVIDEPAWSDPERGARMLHVAGLERVRVRTETFSGTHRDADAALAWTLAWPSNSGALTAEARERWLHDARAAIRDLSWSFPVHYYTAAVA